MCRSSATISEDCLYSIKKIKVVASKGSYRSLCGSRQIETGEKNMYICWLFFYNICFVHRNSYIFVVVNFYMIYFVYKKICWRSERRIGGTSHIASVLNHLNTTSSQYHNLPLSGDSSLVVLLQR